MIPLMIIFLLQTFPASAQPFNLAFQGYLKNLAIRSRSFFTDKAFFLDINRFRGKALVDFSSFIHSELWLDSELLLGNFLNTPDFYIGENLKPKTLLNLNWEYSRGDQYLLRQRLFRAFVSFYFNDIQFTVGRQRIAWGTGYVWNPTDLFNPFNPAAIELEEKEGVDALYLYVPLGGLSRAELVYAPGRGSLKKRVAAKLGSHFHGFDFSFMSGLFQNRWVVGGDFAGSIGGAGLRGEFAYSYESSGQDFFRAILNTDYNFPDDLYVFLEIYFNGAGSSSKKNYNFNALFSGEVFNLAQHYVAISLNKNITPLFEVSFYTIFNFDDGSQLLGPSLVYSLATNLEWAMSAYFFNGSSGSEFGSLHHFYFAHLQYYF